MPRLKFAPVLYCKIRLQNQKLSPHNQRHGPLIGRTTDLGLLWMSKKLPCASSEKFPTTSELSFGTAVSCPSSMPTFSRKSATHAKDNVRNLHPFCTPRIEFTKAGTTKTATQTIGRQQAVQSRGIPHTHPRFESVWHAQFACRWRRNLGPNLNAIMAYAVGIHPHPR